VIKYCKTIIVNDEEVELTSELKAKFISVYESLGSLGERVIGKRKGIFHLGNRVTGHLTN